MHMRTETKNKNFSASPHRVFLLRKRNLCFSKYACYPLPDVQDRTWASGSTYLCDTRCAQCLVYTTRTSHSGDVQLSGRDSEYAPVAAQFKHSAHVMSCRQAFLAKQHRAQSTGNGLRNLPHTYMSRRQDFDSDFSLCASAARSHFLCLGLETEVRSQRREENLLANSP